MSTSAIQQPRYALSAVDKQRQQLERLLKDPSKPAYVPPPPQEKTIRPPREMMKNVQGSSAGAGSGEFHVYKAGRRREYERLAMMAEQAQKESDEKQFERRRQEAAAIADSKTNKNRNKRLKRKGRATKASDDAPLKKRRLVHGEGLRFRRPGEDSDTDEQDDDLAAEQPPAKQEIAPAVVGIIEGARITITED